MNTKGPNFKLSPVPETKSNVRFWYKQFRKNWIAKLPYIKRKRYHKLRVQAEKLSNLFLSLPPLASATPHTVLSQIKATHTDELCLFVTHATEPLLKVQVVDHVHALLDAGIAVVLILNTDCPTEQLSIPHDLSSRLHGCLVRANVGYDFAAWSQAFGLLDLSTIRQRLYLVNDSIVGPLDPRAYRSMLDRIRRDNTDLVGLTANSDPLPHLQSFFLVCNARLLRSMAFGAFMRGILNLPSKQQVIDIYERQLSPYLSAKGYRCDSLFTSLAPDRFHGDDTLFNWARLIEQGFPFIKASVLEVSRHAPEAKRLIPPRYVGLPPRRF